MKNRIAVITGSCTGIGLATAMRLASLEDVEVIITGLNEDDLRQAKSQMINEGLSAFFHVLDVTSSASIGDFQRWSVENNLDVDILINNAGVNLPFEPTPTEPDFFSIDPKNTIHLLEINALGALRMCQALVPGMISRGYGRVVNVSSESGSLGRMLEDPWHYSPSYRISKVGLNAITILLAKEVRSIDILVNSTCPGWVRTRMGGDNGVSSPEEAVDTIIHLANLPEGGPHGRFFGEMRPTGIPNKLDW